ncbi:type II toxin-antitoxin system RelE/ParE family toxin [Streptomyces sp. NPDC050842]|uniref:type II toxin-antitoxin system RelE/ParE family toxin n=1 Tax=Streptomyces sp. NPDC050842 TaxID=3365636 RepID=UPI00379A3B49
MVEDCRQVHAAWLWWARIFAQPLSRRQYRVRLPDLRRMPVGRYRVLYEITEATITIVVIHVGRIWGQSV